MRRIALDRLAIETPGRVPEHRHHNGKAEEKRQRAENERQRNDEAPQRDGERIGARQPKRSFERRDKTNVAVEHQREGNHADAKRERGEAKADQPANDDEQPAAPRGQYVGEEGKRRGRRIGSVCPNVDELGGEDPRREDRKQKQAERQDGGQRGRAKDREGVAASHGQPTLAPAAHLVEAERDKRPDQREAGREGKNELQRACE